MEEKVPSMYASGNMEEIGHDLMTTNSEAFPINMTPRTQEERKERKRWNLLIYGSVDS